MKEFNNRKKADKYAEYITGEELRRYVARKVKQYCGDSVSVFDGAVGSGQLEQFVNPTWVQACEIQEEACEAFKENYPNSVVSNMSFFNYRGNVICDCIIMNPPFSLKFKDLTEEEQRNIQADFEWKKSGVVDDIFILKSLKYAYRYGFYIVFPGILYRKSEKKLRELIGNNLVELNKIQNAFEDTQIDVAFLVIDKYNTLSEVMKEVYDCKAKQVLHSEVVETEEDRWQIPNKPIEREVIDPMQCEIEAREVVVNKLKNQLELSKLFCQLDNRLPPFQDFVDKVEAVVNYYKGVNR